MKRKQTITLEKVIEMAQRGEGILIFTNGQFTAEELVQHMLATMAGVSLAAMKAGELGKGDIPSLMNGAGSVANLPVWIDENRPEDQVPPKGIAQEVSRYTALRYFDTFRFQIRA